MSKINTKVVIRKRRKRRKKKASWNRFKRMLMRIMKRMVKSQVSSKMRLSRSILTQKS